MDKEDICEICGEPRIKPSNASVDTPESGEPNPLRGHDQDWMQHSDGDNKVILKTHFTCYSKAIIWAGKAMMGDMKVKGSLSIQSGGENNEDNKEHRCDPRRK